MEKKRRRTGRKPRTRRQSSSTGSTRTARGSSTTVQGAGAVRGTAGISASVSSPSGHFSVHQLARALSTSAAVCMYTGVQFQSSFICCSLRSWRGSFNLYFQVYPIFSFVPESYDVHFFIIIYLILLLVDHVVSLISLWFTLTRATVTHIAFLKSSFARRMSVKVHDFLMCPWPKICDIKVQAYSS